MQVHLDGAQPSTGRGVTATVALLVAAHAIAASAGPVTAPTPTLTVNHFRETGDPSQATIGRGSPPTSSRIDLGEEIRLGWSVTGCHLREISVSIDGIGAVTPSNTRDREGGCREIWGSVAVQPTRTTTYRLTASGVPTASAAVAPQPVRRSYEVTVRQPNLLILTPVVDQNALRVSLALRNRGDGRLLSTRINVSYSVARAPGHHSPAGTPFHSGSFTAGPLELRSGADVQLGSFTLPDRVAAFAQDAVQFAISLSFPGYPVSLADERQSFNHRWETRTAQLTPILVEALSSLTELRIRLNGYRAGGSWPEVRSDSFVNLTVNGVGDPLTFDTPGQRYNVKIKLRDTDLVLYDRSFGVFINQITAESVRQRDLFAIQDGKLRVHLVFPNSGSGEVKIGEMRDRRWDDDGAPDINIGRFEVNVLLTPELHEGRIGYGDVRVEVPSVSARLEGRFEALNPFIDDHLRRYVHDAILSQLGAVLRRNDVRRAVEDGLARNLALPGATRLVSITGSGDRITITYL